jgi:hypothetical protein
MSMPARRRQSGVSYTFPEPAARPVRLADALAHDVALLRVAFAVGMIRVGTSAHPTSDVSGKITQLLASASHFA